MWLEIMTVGQILLNWKQQLVKRVNAHTFLQKVLTLTAGTAVAQLISVLVAPILTRVYSPEAFGVYGVFTGIIGVGAVFATWRYEQGLVVSRSRSERHGLFALLMLLSLVSSALAFIIASILAKVVLPGSPMHSVLNHWAGLLAVGLGLNGILLSLRFLALKEEAFQTIGVVQVLRVVIAAVIQIAVGFVASGAGVGLPVGLVAAASLGGLYFAWVVYRSGWLNFRQYALSLQRILAAARRNSIYPAYMTWSSLCNSAAPQVPVLLLGLLFPPAALGQFVLAQRIVKMPFALISQSMSQANLQEGAEVPPAELRRVYQGRLRRFFFVGLLPFGALFLVAPWLFSFAFGESWREAGFLTRLILPGLCVQFVFTPFTPFFTVLREQRVYLGWAIVRLVLVGVGVLMGAAMGQIRGATVGYSVAVAASFLLQHFLLMRLLGARGKGKA
jgi:O-antigen/teichoic acid export membrane protein